MQRASARISLRGTVNAAVAAAAAWVTPISGGSCRVPRPAKSGTTPARGRWRRSVAGLAAVVLAVAGCGGGSDEPDPTPSTPSFPTVFPSSVPTDPSEEIRAAALATYRLMWDSFEQAGRRPTANPDAPALARYATGDALQLLRDLLASFRDDGLVIADDSRVLYRPEVVELPADASPPRARIEDCADTTDSALVRADGAPYEDEPGGRRLIYADLEQRAGQWQVTGLAVGSVGTC
jgi:hypothetical protein